MPQLVNYPGPKNLSSAKVYDNQKDLSTRQKRSPPSQENQQLKGEWAPVVCRKVTAPGRPFTGSEGRITVTEESLAGQEDSRTAPEETLVVPGLSTTVQEQSLVIPKLSSTGQDRSHASQGQSREVPEQPLVVPGLSTFNFQPEISFTDQEESLVFPEPSQIGPEQSLVGQGQSRKPPEQSLVVPELSPEGPEQSATNPEKSTGEPVIPFQPTSPPVHHWTWITSGLRPNLSLPKSTLVPEFHEATSSQSVPASTLAPQQYLKTTSAQPQAPLSAGRTGTKNRLVVSNLRIMKVELPLR